MTTLVYLSQNLAIYNKPIDGYEFLLTIAIQNLSLELLKHSKHKKNDLNLLNKFNRHLFLLRSV